MSVLIVGATGGCGRHAYKSCVALGLEVSCLVRDVSKGRDILGPSAKLVQGDLLDQKSLERAMVGKQHVILTIGRTRGTNGSTSEHIDYQGVANAAAAAKLTGIEKVVHVTSNGVDSPQRWFVRFLNYMSGMGLGWKLKGENALRASGVAYVVVRPVGLKNKDHDKPVVVKQCAPYEWGVCMVSRETVGEVCAQALVHAPGCVTLNCREDLNATPSDTWSQTFDWTRAFGKLQRDAGPIPATFEDHVRAVQSAKAWVGGSALAIVSCVLYKVFA